MAPPDDVRSSPEEAPTDEDARAGDRAEQPARPRASLVARQTRPDNLELPFWALDGIVTPGDRLYVRSHFEVPSLDARAWRLRVEGHVDRPFELAYDDLRAMPSRTLPALLECAGNGRVFLHPPRTGLRWELGAVGTAEWTGVPLAAVLARAGVRPGAAHLILEGADEGTLEPPEPPTPGAIAFARSLPLEKARDGDVLLAYAMNGEPLPPEHGFPVRAIVPGWYAMASVKWLQRIIVTDRPFHGYFQTSTYAVWSRRAGLPDLVPVTELQVKAQIARPAPHERVPADTEIRIFGAAWAGEADVARVEVSTDGGRTWEDARLLGSAVRYVWRHWELAWRTPRELGPRVLMARATDTRGHVQPMSRDPDRRDEVVSHVLPIAIVVE